MKFILKAFLRLILLIGFITILPYVIWWICTGYDWIDTIEEINYI